MPEPPASPKSASVARLRGFLSSPSASEMLWAVVDQLIVSGSTFLIGIAAARILGLDQFGRFAIVLILAMLAAGLHNSAVVVPMLTIAGQRRQRSTNYYKAVMVWSAALCLGAGVVVALVVALAFGLRDGEVSATFALAAGAYTAAQNMQLTVRRLYFAQRRAIDAVVLDVMRYMLLLAIMVLAHSAGIDLSVEELLWALAGSALLALLPFVRHLTRGRGAPRLLRVVAARHRPFAVWLLPMTLLTFASEQAITLMLGVLLSDEAAGSLRAGQYLLGVTHFIVMAMENFLPGGAARAYAAGGASALRTYLFKRLVLFGAPTLALIVLLAIFAEPSLRFAFGESYVRFAPILRLYAISYVLIFVRDVWTHYFRAVERTDQIFRAYVASAIVAALLFGPLVLKWEALGAAVVILISTAVSTAYMILAGSRHSRATTGRRPARHLPRTKELDATRR